MDKLFLLGMNGLIWGLIVALIALGLAIIFGLLDIINLAHGDFFMVGTVLAWATLQSTGSFWLAFIVAPLIGLILGALIQPDGDSADPQRGCTFDRGDLRAVGDPSGDGAHHLWPDAGPHPAADCADHPHVRRRL